MNNYCLFSRIKKMHNFTFIYLTFIKIVIIILMKLDNKTKCVYSDSDVKGITPLLIYLAYADTKVKHCCSLFIFDSCCSNIKTALHSEF